MKLRTVTLNQYRNHAHTTMECGEEINALVGKNGEGKTNALEGISYLCLTKSFFGNTDRTALQQGKEIFSVEGEFVSDAGIAYHVFAQYDSRTAEKLFSINRLPVDRFSSVIGQFPVVILSPESNGITARGPGERRKFLDFVISQASKMYLEDLLEYRRIVKQRNRILLNTQSTRSDYSELLEPWDETLVMTGCRITQRREMFLQEFRPHLLRVYESLTGSDEMPWLDYRASIKAETGASLDVLREMFWKELHKRRGEERQVSTTLVGPHRDEMELTLDNLDLRKYASQGQHKTFLIALKVAEFFYLREHKGETPILLLDDVFSELDAGRAARVLEMLGNLGQAFITATDLQLAPEGFAWGGKNRKFFVQHGAVRYVQSPEVYN